MSAQGRERKRRSGGKAPKNILWTTPFLYLGNILFAIERDYQKGHFRSFAEDNRCLEAQDPRALLQLPSLPHAQSNASYCATFLFSLFCYVRF